MTVLDSSAAFHSQLEYVSQPRLQGLATAYAQLSFDLGALRGALPPTNNQEHMSPTLQYGVSDNVGVRSPYQGYHVPQHGLDPRGPASAPRLQQHMGPQYGSAPSQGATMPPQGATMPPQGATMPRHPMQFMPQGQYAQFDPYAFNAAPPQINVIDPRTGYPNSYGMGPQIADGFGQYARRGSEPGPIPSYPRGPPRKPKQSGHALWVGNLPPNANVTDLKDHFSKDATKEIESLFLISKSNCAFVNYRTEAACVGAMNRFHDSRFHGVRLVCRQRRGSTSGSNTSQSLPLEPSETPPSHHSSTGSAVPLIVEEPSSPTIVGGDRTETRVDSSQDVAASVSEFNHKVPEKFFIVKSLTTQDLEASVRNGIWATQSHNEKALNEAYENADNVYLIFSANKSGEYFGYARMASVIAGEPVNLSSTFSEAESPSSGSPHSIVTPATASAPRGRIIDDSARGTIFWEAEHSDDDQEGAPDKAEGETVGNQNWGRQFTIEWVSTARLPFYRTRGLRNPWK